jgi:hypothetical protein
MIWKRINKSDRKYHAHRFDKVPGVTKVFYNKDWYVEMAKALNNNTETAVWKQYTHTNKKIMTLR